KREKKKFMKTVVKVKSIIPVEKNRNFILSYKRGMAVQGNPLVHGILKKAQSSTREGGSEGGVKRKLTFWRNGFSVEGGEFFDYSEPQSRQFLQLIQNGQAPLEVLKVQKGQPVDLQVVHNLNEDFK